MIQGSEGPSCAGIEYQGLLPPIPNEGVRLALPSKRIRSRTIYPDALQRCGNLEEGSALPGFESRVCEEGPDEVEDA